MASSQTIFCPKILIAGLLALLIQLVSGFGQTSTLRFSVVDERGLVLEDLKAEDVRITARGRMLPPTSLAFSRDSPLSVLVLIDASASQERVLPVGKQAAENFINGVLEAGRDHVAIAKFSGEVNLVHDLSSNFESVAARLKEIEFEVPSHVSGNTITIVTGSQKPPPLSKAGSTSLLDSLLKAIGAFAQVDGKGGRKVILLISDGFNTYGEMNPKGVFELATKSAIPIYAVGIGDDFYSGVDKKSLKKLTEGTGGLTIVPDSKDKSGKTLLPSFESTLRNWYTVELPINESDAQEVSVEIVSPKLKKRVKVLRARLN